MGGKKILHNLKTLVLQKQNLVLILKKTSPYRIKQKFIFVTIVTMFYFFLLNTSFIASTHSLHTFSVFSCNVRILIILSRLLSRPCFPPLAERVPLAVLFSSSSLVNTALLFYEVLSDCDFATHTPKCFFKSHQMTNVNMLSFFTHFYSHFRFSQFSYFVNTDTIGANK